MARARDKRLQRLAAHHASTETEADHWRAALEGRIAFCGLVRDLLAELGVDPAQVKHAAAPPGDEAAAELAAGPPPAMVRDAAEPGSKFEREIDRLARRYREDPAIDFAGASLMMVFAWCVAQFGAREEAGGSDPPAANPLQKQR